LGDQIKDIDGTDSTYIGDEKCTNDFSLNGRDQLGGQEKKGI